MKILGIDVGGTGIKGAIVNTETGELISKRRKISQKCSLTGKNNYSILVHTKRSVLFGSLAHSTEFCWAPSEQKRMSHH